MTKLKHVISARQFLDTNLLSSIFLEAEKTEKLDLKGKLPQILKGKIIATLFYEPSTRTRLSFEAAVQKLGGMIVSTESASEFSSAIKGESLEDTIKIIGSYSDCIVMRHKTSGSADQASRVSDVPIINSGDGDGEHPTQALLDIYTIKKEIGALDNIEIALTGDLLYSRTVHSLIPLLSLYKVKIYLVSPPPLRLPQKLIEELKAKKIDFEEKSKLDMLASLDVLYITRVQKERFKKPTEYESVKNSFLIDLNTIKKLKKNAIIMHPLPRVSEIAKEVDLDPRAAYFRQARNGLYIRIALLSSFIDFPLKKK